MSSSTVTAADRLGLALFFAISLHALLILGVSFKPETPATPEKAPKIDIMVVQNIKPPKESKKADFLAQVSQQGSGNTEKIQKPESRPSKPTLPSQQAATSQQRQAPPVPQQKARKALVSQQARTQIKVARSQPKKPSKTHKKTLAKLLASRDQEIARLSAELSQRTHAYAKRPRRKAISASTQEYRYASYLDAWRRKVERIGNLNYPDEARRKKLYGNLVVHVAVRADGTVERIRLLHSSGYKVLDDAAIRIVRMSAPFSPFPADIRKHVDILDITRTWQFLSSNRLRAGD
ncbi:MAG: energy transducer TonB [gamma proteobacterium symbiont of Bathyaustriella thionipta]|nr:energy transducer TonB [gamma proteobacterium symbiont of Bathyaustriella thionipta]